jgi:hypothetical protein
VVIFILHEKRLSPKIHVVRRSGRKLLMLTSSERLSIRCDAMMAIAASSAKSCLYPGVNPRWQSQPSTGVSKYRYSFQAADYAKKG